MEFMIPSRYDLYYFQVEAKKHFQRASPMRLVRVYPHITPDQEVVIRRADYGGLLDIKCSKLFPELCKFLMESFDPVSCKLVFPGRGAIPVTEPSVQEVLGLPRGNRDVRYEIDAEAIAFMSKEFGKTGSKQPLLTSLETKLVAMKKADSRFLRLFIAYGLSAVVAPTTSRISAQDCICHS